MTLKKAQFCTKDIGLYEMVGTMDFGEEYEEVKKEAEVSLDKSYCLPSQVSIHKHGNLYLVIYTEGISWLVLENDIQLSIFELLRRGCTVGEALAAFGEDNVSNVIMQIEAKRFFDPPCGEKTEKDMYVLLTNRCNQRCRHCYMFAGDVKYDELTISQWINVLDNFKRCGGNGVTFTGGEVTVYCGYDKIIKHAHGLGLAVTVLTNGMLWSQNAVDELHSFIDEVQVSVDGYDRASYFSVRRYDGFSSALDCIRRFYEKGTKVSMAVTPLLDDLDAFVDGFARFARGFLAEYPEVFIKLNLELIQGREVHATPSENKEYRSKLRHLVELLYPDYYMETFALNYEDHILRRNCGFGEISIAPNGDVYWCNRIPELNPAANVLAVDFDSIMALSNRIKENTSVDNTTSCMDCDIRYVCGGGCRLEYEGIKKAGSHTGEWTFKCKGKDDIYNKMILSNDYFFL